MGPDGPSLRTIIARHKRETAVVVALVIVLIGTMAATALPSSRSSAGQSQQATYARLYLTEYGGTRDAASVVSAINSACTHAAYLGEADDVSVVAAINHAF
jgi:hypothetical protein